MAYINYNGKFLDEKSPIVSANNRGLKFGDGLFETIKFKKNNLILIDEHLSRLWNGLKLLQFEIPKLFTPEFIENEILQLIQKNKLNAARIRLSIIRGNGGLYDPEDNKPHYIIQSWPLPETNGSINENGLQCCLFRDALKSIDKFSNCKHNNYLPYLMGAIHAKKEKYNDAIILNTNQNICDTTIANIFLIKDNKIITPSLIDGCIAGVMRDFTITELKKSGYAVSEKSITEDELLNADEVFLTNSIYNVRWVAQIENKFYHNQKIVEIYRLLSQTKGQIFC